MNSLKNFFWQPVIFRLHQLSTVTFVFTWIHPDWDTPPKIWNAKESFVWRTLFGSWHDLRCVWRGRDSLSRIGAGHCPGIRCRTLESTRSNIVSSIWGPFSGHVLRFSCGGGIPREWWTRAGFRRELRGRRNASTCPTSRLSRASRRASSSDAPDWAGGESSRCHWLACNGRAASWPRAIGSHWRARAAGRPAVKSISGRDEVTCRARRTADGPC